jgi:signal transduction histidine kinase
MRQLLFSFLIVISFQLLSVLATMGQSSTDLSWERVKEAKKGSLSVYWFESRPFIYKNADEQLAGIEYELIKGLAEFVKQKHNVDLEINWIEDKTFENVFYRLQHATAPCFGASAFSITQERQALVNFSPPYMSDIMVMISNKNIPITESAEEFYRTFTKLRAVTIKGTTYEHDLLQLKQKLEMPFEIDYISSAQNILRTIEERENTFGFIDLPMYMMYFSENPSIMVRRQNFNPVKRDGYGFLIPKESDWIIAVNEYFSQRSFRSDFEKVIAEHLDIQMYRFVESLAMQDNKNVELLTKEKEIQDQDISNKAKQIEEQIRTNYFLTALFIVVFFSLVIIIVLFRKSTKQRKEIEVQQKNIELKNQQLEQRNQHLVMLDEEKNNLIKILAHDMRAPLGQMQGLSMILATSDQNMTEEQRMTITHIQEASVRLAKMISNILDVDAIEGSRINFIPENTLVMPLVQQIVDSFKTSAAGKNISLSVGSLQAGLMIQVDSLYMTQVLENLISNAIKFSNEGKKVEVVVSNEQDKVRISVKDQGPGLTESDQANLYKKFQRLSARPTKGEGSIGLGLAIVKKYVELMGGRVWCESEPGMGAAFNVEFDRVEQS